MSPAAGAAVAVATAAVVMVPAAEAMETAADAAGDIVVALPNVMGSSSSSSSPEQVRGPLVATCTELYDHSSVW